MNTLIAYATKYGCVEKCALILSEKLTGEVDLYNLKEIKNIDISRYDKVIIGGSIYIGKIQKVVREFSSTKLNQLKEKEVGLFICGMGEGETAKKELKCNLSDYIRSFWSTAEADGLVLTRRHYHRSGFSHCPESKSYLFCLILCCQEEVNADDNCQLYIVN